MICKETSKRNPLPAMWSSWILVLEDSTLCLVDSWDSAIQPYTVLEFFSDAMFGFAVTFVMLLGSILHGMAAAMELSSFLLVFFENFFVLFVIRIDKVKSSQSSSNVELWFFLCPFLFFSILTCFTNVRRNFWPYVIWSGSRLNLCQSPPGPYIYIFFPFGDFSFSKVNLVNHFQETDK